ncbi:MAG TPA: S-adenosylmethionine:tRNA ribosyltransferase-isomerase [Actinomycetota bacterium]
MNGLLIEEEPAPASAALVLPAPRPGLAFELPAVLRAGAPPESRGLARDEVRLMVSEGSRAPLSTSFRDLPRHLRPGDLLVINTSATMAALLDATTPGGPGGRRVEVELRLVTPLPPHGLWVVELPATAMRRPDASGGPAATLASARGSFGRGTVPPEPPDASGGGGGALPLAGGGYLQLLAPYGNKLRAVEQPRLWIGALHLPAQLGAYLHAYGRPARPPGVTDDWPLSVYQTCFARQPGSTAMASAGRAFTPELLCALLAGGIAVAPLCLHTCGVADDDAPLPEPYEVPAATARLVNATRAAGGRVVAVGTTVVRALETVTDSQGQAHPAQGLTDTVVTPEHGVRGCDGLLTGWHEPNGSHLHRWRRSPGWSRWTAPTAPHSTAAMPGALSATST